ncbi:hypothetical protein FB45DRAFT_738334 [Roridomyces roridus]|uniref:Cyclin N-terminal domain-containing protein n=1 Tax=Roridomyces roridus TaxID=1738132 RepID=A0AAD7C8Q3_9AGAR|nr:hypothetical protein FB45DRAFT_738334 [Roridomyces roridus]
MVNRSATPPSVSTSSSPSSYYSPSTSGSDGPVHAASLVDPLRHSPELLQLLDIKLSPPVIEYVVDCVTDVVEHALTASGAYPLGLPTLAHSSLISFASNVFTRAEVPTATVLVSLTYIARARSHLCISIPQYAFERVFLGALICASKYTNDSALKNVHWGICSGVFGKRDIGRIEREFLDVLGWQLGIREEHVLAHYAGLMRAAGPPVSRLLNVALRHHRHSSTSSTASVPGLEPSSPESRSASPSPSPRTPPPRSAPSVPQKLPPDVPMDVGDMYDVELHAPGPIHGSKTYGSRFHELLRTFSVAVRRPPLPHPHYHPHSRPPSTGPLSLVV